MKKKWTIKPTQYNPGKVYLTRNGYEKIKEEFNYLLNTKRPEITKAVSAAAALGDRSENADYIYSKKALRQCDGRIYRLQKQLENTIIVEKSEFPKDYIGFGSTITLLNLDTDEEKTIQIVGIYETNIEKGKIAYNSPLAKALMKKKVNDCILFSPPKGEIEYQILKIT